MMCTELIHPADGLYPVTFIDTYMDQISLGPGL